MPRTINATAHAARRDEFIDAGQRLIQTRGYERFSIEELLATVGASKGAFYHYFDSKPALLEAIVERFATGVVTVVAKVVEEPGLDAVEKLQRYFGGVARLKTERKDFLDGLLPIWYSDDNAIVREKMRRQTVRRVTGPVAAIIRQGIAEGSFTLSDPDQMARVVLALILDAGDEAGELYLARQTGAMDIDHVRARLATYAIAIERILGVPPGRLHLVDEPVLQTWFG